MTETTTANIKTELANYYLNFLQTQARDDPSGLAKTEMDWRVGWDIHNQTFPDNGLSPDAWTLNTPFNMLNDQGREQLWNTILNSVQEGLAQEAWIDAGVASLMNAIENFALQPWQAQAASWNERVYSTGFAVELVATALDEPLDALGESLSLTGHLINNNLLGELYKLNPELVELFSPSNVTPDIVDEIIVGPTITTGHVGGKNFYHNFDAGVAVEWDERTTRWEYPDGTGGRIEVTQDSSGSSSWRQYGADGSLLRHIDSAPVGNGATYIQDYGSNNQLVSQYLDYHDGLDAVPLPNPTGPTTNALTLTTHPTLTPSQDSGSDPTAAISADNATLFDSGLATILGVGNVNTVTGNEQAANAIATGDLRPAAQSILDTPYDLYDWLMDDLLRGPEDAWLTGAQMNAGADGNANSLPVDPLVLDLNGDGVKLVSFNDAPVLFDIDHDGGSKELTGWVDGTDGLLAHDRNGNGVIDDISELFSEYYGGAVGTGGEAGTTPHTDGFAALKTLDSNGDNAYSSADAKWSEVKVWVDADHDGVTDTGELKTLANLGITRIDLAATRQSGLVQQGNEILASGSFTQNGVTRTALAARFIADPTGNTIAASGAGQKATDQDGRATYVSTATSGATLSTASLGVAHLYGGTGNDRLTGDANANWLAGEQGADAFDAGAGDDVLLIDAADLQADVRAGGGFDMGLVVGDEGVTLNLAQAELEVVVGGRGNDVLIGGGRESVFVRGGAGDDLILGGAANDAAMGEDGADLLDGGAGNDVLRGGRGVDEVLGGAGDDLLFAGQDDDRLAGGAGNDVLQGDPGDDLIDGGEGTDVAVYTGSYSDYVISQLDAETWLVADRQAGRDGVDSCGSGTRKKPPRMGNSPDVGTGKRRYRSRRWRMQAVAKSRARLPRGLVRANGPMCQTAGQAELSGAVPIIASGVVSALAGRNRPEGDPRVRQWRPGLR